MLYTKKEVEKIYSNLITEHIANGARIDFNHNSKYISGEFDCHVDLIDDNWNRIIIYIVTHGEDRSAFRRYDSGLCEIVVSICEPVKNGNYRFNYNEKDAEKITAYRFYRYKNIYTDNEEEYKRMVEIGKTRNHYQIENEYAVRKINYDPYLVLSIVKNHKGYKRTKLDDINLVLKYYGKYHIYVNHKDTLVIG